ncbi:hypothetical protein ACFQYP_20255 [Nonomuraea antimicrobica]|uniref:hypothetical protein n=1 Tax=Nonomuraea antimicrobica TaxID=561173 RepID=UPI0031EDED9F
MLEFQRDMISENTREGVAAGKTLGRPAALDQGGAATLVEAYRQVRTAGDEGVCQALASGQTIRRGHSCSVRIAAPLAFDCAALEQSAALAGSSPAARKAHRMYAARVTATQP